MFTYPQVHYWVALSPPPSPYIPPPSTPPLFQWMFPKLLGYLILHFDESIVLLGQFSTSTTLVIQRIVRETNVFAITRVNQLPLYGHTHVETTRVQQQNRLDSKERFPCQMWDLHPLLPDGIPVLKWLL